MCGGRLGLAIYGLGDPDLSEDDAAPDGRHDHRPARHFAPPG